MHEHWKTCLQPPDGEERPKPVHPASKRLTASTPILSYEIQIAIKSEAKAEAPCRML